MMGTQAAPEQFFYDFCLEDHVPDDHLLRRIDRFIDLSDVRQKLKQRSGSRQQRSRVRFTLVSGDSRVT
jgi:transposase